MGTFLEVKKFVIAKDILRSQLMRTYKEVKNCT